MSRVDEFIRTKVDKKRQSHAYETAEELWDFFKALDNKSLLRTSLRSGKSERTRVNYLEIQQNADKILESFNKFFYMYVDDEKRDRFFRLTQEFGFTEEDLVHLLHTELMFIFLLNTEMFKNWLTFILRDITPMTTLGKLFGTDRNVGKLVEKTRETGEALKVAEHLDIALRNALAHFTFREDGSTIYCYDHVKDKESWVLQERKVENLELFDKMREHNLLRTLLALVITDWYA